MAGGNLSDNAADTQRTCAESHVRSDDRGNEQADLRMADPGAEERGLHDQQNHREQRPCRAAGKPEGRRVPDAGRADLQAIQAELQRSAAIRELGRNALKWVQENPETYKKMHFELFGRMPSEI